MAEAKKPFSEQVAENLIEQLKAGTAPWQKPWEAGDGTSMFPMNPTTGKRYKGINAMHLMAQGRTDQRWMTFKQAQAVDAQVRKGERGTPIQYWKFQDEQTKLDDKGKPVLDAKGEPIKQVVKLERPRVFMATVFNAEQIDGLPELERKPQTWDANERAESILKASGADIRHGGNQAFYRPSADHIQMPDRGQFPNAGNYYATAIHELGHWTGHETRLDRDLANPFGSEAYAKEELRAEIASMILGAEIGLGRDPGQHAAYVGLWIKALKEDPMEIFRAAADAEKIQDYVLAFEQKLTQEQDAALIQPQQQAVAIAQAQPGQDYPEAFIDQVGQIGSWATARNMPMDWQGVVNRHPHHDSESNPPWGASDWEGLAKANKEFYAVTVDDGRRHVAALRSTTFKEALVEAAEKRPLAAALAATDLRAVIFDDANTTFDHYRGFGGASQAKANESLEGVMRNRGFDTVADVTGTDPDKFMEVALVRLSPIFGIKPEDTDNSLEYLERKGLAQAFALKAEQIHETLTKEREAVQVPPTPAQNRQAEIQAELAALGYRMEPSLDALAGDEGHAIIDLSTGEVIDPPNDKVLALASEWSRLEGVTEDQEPGLAVDVPQLNAERDALTPQEAAVSEAFKQIRELPGDHPDREAKAKAFASAAKELIGVPLPADWSGNVQIMGVAERDGRKIDAANAGVEPEEFHLYARRANVEFGGDAYALVAVRQTEDHAQQTAERLALIEAHAHSNPLEQAARLAYVNEERVRNDPNSTEEAISAAREARKNAEFLATTNDADLQKRIAEEERLLAQRANDQIAPDQARQPDQASQAKTFINVPFKEKNEAKGLGAKWDREAQSWYIPPGMDAAPFAKWQQNGQNQAQEPANAVRQGQDEGNQAQAPKAPENSRQFLAVPYGERNAAKAAGAKWDAAAKSWYAPPGADTSPLQRWLPQNVQAEQAPAQSPTDEFAEAMQSVGLTVPAGHPIMDGKRHRVPVLDDKKGEKTGFYIGHLDGHPAGYIKNNRSGVDMKWKSKGYTLDPEQKALLQAEAAQKLQDRAAEQAATQEQVAQKVANQMKYLGPIMEPTPYLQDKGIQVHPGAFTDRDGQKTYIPVYDKDGKQWSMQYIQEDGTKRFPKDSRKEGCFHIVGGWEAIENAPAIVIAEGYATAATLAEALGHGTVAAFDSGNLKAVAETFRELYPDKAIVICGDDDLAVEQKYGRNPGKAAAIEAAQAVGGECITPIFAPGEQASNPKGFTDYNDLATKSSLGAERVRGQVLPMVELAVERAEQRKLAQSQQQGIDQAEKPEQQRARRAMSH